MKLIDIIIIAILVVISSLIIYFVFWKNRKKPCHGCPYAKNCTSMDCVTKNSKNIDKKDTD